MSKNQRVFKLFVVLLFSTAFIFSFSHFGVEAFGNSQKSNGGFSNGTFIGYLDVSGKTVNEAAGLLEEKYVEWLKDTNITLQYQEKREPFTLDLFHLNSKQTIASLKDGQKNPAFITIDQTKVKEQLANLFPQLKSNDYNINKVTASLTETASSFQKGTFTLDLTRDFLKTKQTNQDVVLSTASIFLKEIPSDLQSFIDHYPKINIAKESSFSLLSFINEKKVMIQADTLNLLSSAIYQAILPSNFTVDERDIGNTLPIYSHLGFEAKVNKDTKEDLVFSNPNKERCYLDLQLDNENDNLIVTLKGVKLLYTYKISKKDEQQLEPKTIIQYSPLVLPGKIKILNSGAPGKIVKIFRNVYQGEQLVKSEFISEDYYPPSYRIEIHALSSSTNTGAQQSVSSSSAATAEQTAINSDTTNQTNSQTANDIQPVSNETNLWGKPNEQPK